MSYVDTSMLYHMIKSQSVIKLYLMYNMIEVADRLFSAFGKLLKSLSLSLSLSLSRSRCFDNFLCRPGHH